MQPCHLTSLAEELEESVCCHVVTVILWRRQDEPHSVLVAALPSRDLSWEMSKLQGQGYSGLLETSSEICMCEGDQLLLRFSGNITSKGRMWGSLTELLKNVPHYGHTEMNQLHTCTSFYILYVGECEWKVKVLVIELSSTQLADVQLFCAFIQWWMMQAIGAPHAYICIFTVVSRTTLCVSYAGSCPLNETVTFLSPFINWLVFKPDTRS